MQLILKAAMKFASIIVFCLCNAGNISMAQAQDNSAPPVVISFTQNQELDNWIIVNDTVMGGRSRTRLNITEDKLEFSGVLSLANNGGFASIRRVYDGKNWVNGGLLQIQVEGDGRQYQLRLRTNRRADGVAYVVSFQTQAQLSTLFEFETADFVPQFRGRIISGAPALQFSDIEQVGIMLADKSPGEFTLKVEHISQVKRH